MTKKDLELKLKQIYKNCEKVTRIHLFGIEFSEIILANKYSFKYIEKETYISKMSKIEITRSAGFSKYVKI